MTPGWHCFSNIQASSEWVNISGGVHQFKTLNFRSTRRPRDAMSVVRRIQFIKAKKQRRPEGRQSQFISIPQQQVLIFIAGMVNYTGPINLA